ncbi:MAG: hypothetical protein EB022_02140 [Proteobacteria bacterium]|nr:hypothetical protein [Pseudomonadota bacterium]
MIYNYFYNLFTKVIFIIFFTFSFNLMANEQPDYTVIKKDNEFEIRQYTNFLTAKKHSICWLLCFFALRVRSLKCFLYFYFHH